MQIWIFLYAGAQLFAHKYAFSCMPVPKELIRKWFVSDGIWKKNASKVFLLFFISLKIVNIYF